MTRTSSQQSALSFQPQAPRCRIICDENEDDFRLALCRTFCAGACPGAQPANPQPASHNKPVHSSAHATKKEEAFIREHPCKSVAVFLKTHG